MSNTVYKFKEICTKIGSGATPKGGKSSYCGGTISLIRSQNVHDFSFQHNGLAYINDEQAKKLDGVQVLSNDILLNITGDSVARACIVDDVALPARVNQHVSIIRIKQEVALSEYVLNYLIMRKDYLLSLAKGGSTRNALTKEMIEELSIELPPIDEQKKIVSILKSIELKLHNNEKINDNLQRQLKLIYDYWFTQFDFPDENGKPYRSSGGAMVWNEQLKRDIPVGWECKTLGDLLIKNNEVFDFGKIEPTIDLSVMPSASISLQELNSSDQFTTNLFIMHEGDILFGSIRPYLKKAGIAPCNGVIAGTVHSYRTKNDEDYNFVLFTLCRDSFFDYALSVSTGTKMPVIDSDNILSYKVPYSKDIVKLFDEVKIKNIICKNIQEIQRLSELRDWLLPMLMNSQLSIMDKQEEHPRINDLGFEQWIINQGVAARGDVDMEVLRDIYEAMDSDDK